MREGWVKTTLGDVALVQSGVGFPNSYQGSNDLKLPVYKVSDMNLVGNELYMVHSNNTISEEMRQALGAFIFPPGSIIFPKIGGAIATNKKRIVTKDCCADNNVMGLVPKKEAIDSRFLYYFLQSFNLSDFANKAHLPSIKKTVVSGWPIDVPANLAEQHRIVAKLDEAFDSIASAKEKAEQNLLNARALFDSYLDDVFSKRGEGWDEKQLSELCERITKGSSPKWQGVSYVDRPGILFVTSENVGQNKLLLDNPKYVEEKFNVKDKKSILRKGDVLTNIVGASIGRTAIFDLEIVANINQAVCLMRCFPSLLNNAYLTFLLNSKVFKKILHDNEVNNARANLSLGFFSKLYIPLPNLDIQINIVTALNEIQKKVEDLESLYQQKITALDELKQSLLHQAFSGEL